MIVRRSIWTDRLLLLSELVEFPRMSNERVETEFRISGRLELTHGADRSETESLPLHGQDGLREYD